MTPRSAGYKHALNPKDYLEQRYKIVSDCWEFTGPKDRDGYGQVHSTRAGKDTNTTRAHQLSYVAYNGPISSGMCVCHTCDNPTCINPSHLFLGTIKDNNKDKQSKNRQFAKLNLQTIEKINKYKGTMSSRKVAKLFNLSFTTILKVWKETNH